MKEIKAVIQPFMLDNTMRELRVIKDLPGCIISKVSAFGRSHGKQASELADEAVEMLKLEFVVKDAVADDVLRAIQKGAHTGNPGDGKIFVIEVADAASIRSGSRGEKAL